MCVTCFVRDLRLAAVNVHFKRNNVTHFNVTQKHLCCFEFLCQTGLSAKPPKFLFFLNECINSGLKLWFVKGVDRVTFVICVIMMYSV